MGICLYNLNSNQVFSFKHFKMTDVYEYSKARKNFGRHPQFEDSMTKMVCEQMPDSSVSEAYLLRDPNKISLDNIPVHSQHGV